MIKKLMFIIILSLCLILTSCQLVIEKTEGQTTTTTLTTNGDTRILIGFVMEEYDELTKTYHNPNYYKHGGPIDILPSHFFDQQKITRKGENEHAYEMSYLVDLDHSTCYMLSEVYLENNIVKTGHGRMVCNSSQAILTIEFTSSYTNSKNTYQVTFTDIDYLEEYKVIQFDINHNKIKEDLIILKDGFVPFQLQKETVDFIILKRYKKPNQDIYEQTKLVSVSKIKNSIYKDFADVVVSFNNENQRYRSVIKFTIEEVQE